MWHCINPTLKTLKQSRMQKIKRQAVIIQSAPFKSEIFHREETNEKQNKTFPLMRSQGSLPAHAADSLVHSHWMFNPDAWIFSIVLIQLGKDWCKRENGKKGMHLLTDATLHAFLFCHFVKNHLAGLNFNWQLYNLILFYGANWFFCLFKLTTSLTQSSDWLWWPSSSKHSDASGADGCLPPQEVKHRNCCTLCGSSFH